MSFYPRSAPSDPLDSVEEMVGHELNVGIGKDAARGPADCSINNGPDLAHIRFDDWEELPSPDDTSAGCRGHDVNDEMLAEKYRRGLRIGRGYRIVADDLSFVFGDGDDMVPPPSDAT